MEPLKLANQQDPDTFFIENLVFNIFCKVKNNEVIKSEIKKITC